MLRPRHWLSWLFLGLLIVGSHAHDDVPDWAVFMLIFFGVVILILVCALVYTVRAMTMLTSMLHDYSNNVAKERATRERSCTPVIRNPVTPCVNSPFAGGLGHSSTVNSRNGVIIDLEHASSGFHTPPSHCSMDGDFEMHVDDGPRVRFDDAPKVRIDDTPTSSHIITKGTFDQLSRPLGQTPQSTVPARTSHERGSIEKMRALVPAGAGEAYMIFGAHEPLDDDFFMRFLIARQFDVKQSSALMLAYLKWRATSYPEGPPIAAVQRRAQFGVVYIDFLDRESRKVIVVRARYHNKNWTTEETKHVIVEWLDGALHGASAGVHQFSVLVDLEGFGYANADMTCLKNTLSILDNFFPERLGNLWFIHANFVFMSLWKVVKGFVDPRTASKIHFYGPEFKEMLPAQIDPAVLPEKYGGQAPNPPVVFIGRLHPPGVKMPAASS